MPEVRNLRPEIHPTREALANARAAVGEMTAHRDLAERLAPFSTLCWDGVDRQLPTLHLDDLCEIPFLDEITAVEEYTHRSRIRAGGGDLFVAVTDPTAGYEQYCRERLGIGAPRLVDARATRNPLAVAASCTKGPAYEAIVAAARAAGGLVVHPYMSIAPVWDLARRVAEDTGLHVSVIGPPPPVTWIANDKLAFQQLVARVLGEEWLTETRRGTTQRELADHLLALAERHGKVGLKRLRCASAMGNAVFDSSDLQRWGPARVESEVAGFLRRTQWDGVEEVLAVAWQPTDLSPSTQLWIPPLGKGAPRLDGIYVQILEGPEKVFVGSRPSALPEAVERVLGEAALTVGAGLQALGYAGRCSFDHLVLGDPDDEFRVLFTECNGRWGGTSLPMSLIERIVPGPRPPYRAQDVVHPGLVGMTFHDVLARVGDEVFDPKTGRGRFVFYNVGPLEPVGKLDVIALGRTQDEAERAMTETIPALLGL